MTDITNFNKSTPKLCGAYLIIPLPPQKRGVFGEMCAVWKRK